MNRALRILALVFILASVAFTARAQILGGGGGVKGGGPRPIPGSFCPGGGEPACVRCHGTSCISSCQGGYVCYRSDTGGCQDDYVVCRTGW